MATVLRWGEEPPRHALVAADSPLVAALAAALPDARPEPDAPRDTPIDAVVAARGRLDDAPTDAIEASQAVILLDPTERDHLLALDLLAGRSESRLVVVPALGTIAAAEHTLLLALALARHLFRAYSDLVSGARRPGLASRLTDETVAAPNWVGMETPGWLWGKTLGLVGLGRVGVAVAERARAFGMRLIYHDLEPRPALELRLGLERRRLDQLLREADVVSLHLPLTPDTVRLIDAPELALMKPSAILINTAHGRLIDEGSLIRALREGAIAGAGLDVFAYEPISADSPLLALDNVVLTPHVAGVPEALERQAAARQAAEALARLVG